MGKRELGATILVVDDEPFNQKTITRVLKRQGYTVIAASHGEEALQQLQAQSVDLILLDVLMPIMDGFQTLQHIRSSNSLVELPIIMLSGLSDNERVIAALEQGANDYVTKPFDVPILLARIRTHLAHKRSVEENEEFFHIASHDLKKPLSLIADVAEVLGDSLKEPGTVLDDVRDMVELIRSSANNMQQLINDYLDLKVLDHGQFRLNLGSVDIHQILEKVMGLDRDYARSKDIHLELELGQGLPATLADPQRLQQVLSNLVGNAIKFSPQATRILIRTYRLGEQIAVDIIDQGPGLTDDDREQLFMKYASLSNKPTGGETSTGLGLSICKMIMDAHAGSIEAKNNPDRGATFSIKLPVATTAMTQESA